MRIVSVNTGVAVPFENGLGRSAIDKRPRAGRVAIGSLGLEGDDICDLENHGGADQAVYLYSLEDYAFWEAELDRPLRPGLFGENLTVAGIVSTDAMVGDRYACGGGVLEVTSPRIPCSTFARHVGVSDMPARFMAARRPGIYCRVVMPGTVGEGDALAVTPATGPTVTLGELVETYPYKRISEETRQRYLATPLNGRLAAYLRGDRARP
ncbi:MAG: MOSC domain-containing protein [Notoacmeibacter sp.]|nr:MOSC domain-containing protein [Notoacmeibacter sp.]